MTSFASHMHNAARVIEATAATDAATKTEQAVQAIIKAFSANKPLLVCGNGGSAADAMHIAGELVGRFLKNRKALKCISLASDPAVLTAWSNDIGYDSVFSRQVEAYGEAGGILWGISTSGNSANVCAALHAAKAQGMVTIGLTGEGGGKMAGLCDILIAVPSRRTPDIQQAHLCIYHYICEQVEAALSA